jgi:hypothetical protein
MHEYLPSAVVADSCALCRQSFESGDHRKLGRTGRKRKLLPEQELTFVEWFKSVRSLGSLDQKAWELKVSISTLRSILIRHGCPTSLRSRWRRPLSPKE